MVGKRLLSREKEEIVPPTVRLVTSGAPHHHAANLCMTAAAWHGSSNAFLVFLPRCTAALQHVKHSKINQDGAQLCCYLIYHRVASIGERMTSNYAVKPVRFIQEDSIELCRQKAKAQ